MPAPPYSGGHTTPIRPIWPSLVKTSRGNSCFSSHSRAWGASSLSANSRTVFLRSCCSSLRLKSKGSSSLVAAEPDGTLDRSEVKRLLLALLALAAAYALYVALGLPSRAEVRALATTNPGATALMRQRDQEARRAGRPPRRRAQAWVPLSRVSRHLIRAVLASEDQRFFGHDGVDW